MQLDWIATINSLREAVPTAQFQTWIKPLSLIQSSGERVVLGVPSRFHREWVSSRYSDHVKRIIKQQMGCEPQLEFEILVQEENIEASLTPIPVTPPIVQEAQKEREKPNLRIVPAEENVEKSKSEAPNLPQFAHPYFESAHNQFAVQCVHLFCEQADPRMKLFICYCGVGMGKTHLMTEAGREVHRRFPQLRIRYTSSDAFTSEYVTALKSNDLLAFKRRYQLETDVLLFDDVHQLKGRMKIQEELLHIFNQLVSRGGSIFFTAAIHPSRLEDFQEALKSRLISAVTAEIKYPSFAERVELMGKMAGHQGLEADPLALRTLADSGQKDLRELFGTLFRLHLQAKLENRNFDHQFLAKEGHAKGAPREAITLAEIMALVEHNYGVSRVDLLSKSRKGAITWARQVAMFLARSYTLHPLEEIGKHFGRDHATVIHAFQKVTEAIEEQPTRRYEVEFLRQKLQMRAPNSTKTENLELPLPPPAEELPPALTERLPFSDTLDI